MSCSRRAYRLTVTRNRSAAKIAAIPDQVRDELTRWELRSQVRDGDDDSLLHEFERRQYAFARRLARANDARRVHALILRTLASAAHARTGVLATYHPDRRALSVSATMGDAEATLERLRVAVRNGLLASVFASGRPQVRDVGSGSDSYLLLPIAGAGGLAVAAFADRRDAGPLNGRDIADITVLSATAALALDREALAAELVEMRLLATIDPVTDVYNRRYLETRLEAEVQRATRQQQDLALLMVDIDDFKQINDRWGHIEGDRVLREIAELLRDRVRVFDVCARFGGEEFVILMPGAGHQIAVAIADRIRREVKSRTSHPGMRVTISVGVGLLGRLTNPMALLASADRALIVAKGAGKDAVWVDDPDGSPRQTAYDSVTLGDA